MASRLFWHVPSWYQGGPAATAGHANVGSDIVLELVETETAEQSLAPDSYWVERIVGQYQVTGIAQPTSGIKPDAFVHHRVYVCQAGASYIQIRAINTTEDADTSWMMHKVEQWDGDDQADSNQGNWGRGNQGDLLTLAPPISRMGGFDIKVGRKVEEGESLVWHTNFVTQTGDPTDSTFFVKLWVRVLMKQL